jgi:thioredoxin-related protein
MNKLVVAIFLFLHTSIRESQAQLFSTYKGWEETKGNARLANKQILLYFGGSWCAPCKRLKDVVFVDSSIQSLLKSKFQCYAFDYDQDTGIIFLKKYAITAIPIILILNNEGFLKAVIQSVPEDLTEFKQEINRIAESDFTFKGVSNEMDLDYPRFYNDFYISGQKNFPDSTTVTDYLKSQTDLYSEVNWNVLNLFNTDDEFFNYVLTNKERYKELYGSLEVGIKLQHIYTLFFKKYTALRDSVSYNKVIGKFLLPESDSNYTSSLRSYYMKEIRFLAYTGMDWNKFVAKAKLYIQNFGDRDERFIFNYLEYSPNKNDSLYRVLPYVLHAKSNP